MNLQLQLVTVLPLVSFVFLSSSSSEYRDPTKHEELVMNAVYAFNNLTFYIDAETSMDAIDKQMAIAESKFT